MRVYLLSLLFSFSLVLNAQEYSPDWESLDSRQTPVWYTNARFGILVHWGLFSVPAYRPYQMDKDGYPIKEGTYAEWYLPDVMYKPQRNNNFHKKAYGENFSYFDFLPMFRAELYDPEEWVDLFREAGAQYVILTAKHYDGFSMWPSKEKFSTGWNAGAVGPKKDLAGQLVLAARNEGMKVGFYYSFLEYWTTKTLTWPKDPAARTGFYVPYEIWEKYHIPEDEFVNRIHFQVKELINNYQPDIFWADGEWDYAEEDLESKELLSWIYNEAPNKEIIVVNDRWASGTRGKHGGVYTSEDIESSEDFEMNHPWEKTTSIGYSYGYNRAETFEDYKSADDLIEILAKTTAKGGNFLLNVGASADGMIPIIMQERLKKIGDWMSVNREAVYGTIPYVPDTALWVVNPKAGEDVLFTQSGKYIYILLSNWKIDAVNLKEFPIGKYSTAVHLKSKSPVEIKINKNSIILELPPDRNERVSVVRIENIAEKQSKK